MTRALPMAFVPLAVLAVSGCNLLHVQAGGSQAQPHATRSDAVPSSALPREPVLWKEARNKVRLPELTREQKGLIVEQALLLMDVFVHDEVKRARYGDALWPKPRLLRLKEEIPNLSEEEFHSRMIEIFLSLRDFHTNYYLPEPYACYRVNLPFYLTKTREDDGEYAIRVLKLKKRENFPAELQFVFDSVKPGARLLSYDGLAPFEAERAHHRLSAGASVDPRDFSARDLLTRRPGQEFILPKEDAVKVVLQNPDGKILEQEIPWALRADTACLDRYEERVNPPAANATPQEGANRFESAAPEASGSALVATRENILRYQKEEFEGKSYGIVKLESFSPTMLSVPELIRETGSILDSLQDTEGLVIDLRDNGGGNLPLAEGLVQLFTKEKPSMATYRMKNNPLVRETIRKHPWLSPWVPFLDATPPTAPYITGPAFLSPEETSNSTGQHYFGPVTLLVNPACYSACDVFAGLMQDNRAALVWGEGSWQTGGGGANVWELSSLVAEGLPFKVLPEGMDMRVSLRQLVRGGKNLGRLLEDDGVEVDRVVDPTLQDLLEDGAHVKSVLFRDLSARKARLPVSRGVTGSRTILIDVPATENPRFPLEVENTDEVVLRIDGESPRTIPAPIPTQSRLLVEVGRLEKKLTPVELTGYRGGKPTWRLVRTLRRVPPFAPFPSRDSSELSWVAKEQPLRVQAFPLQPQSPEWTLVDGILQTNAGSEYAADTRTGLSWFVRLADATRAQLELDLEVDTELDYDFLFLEVESGNSVTRVPLSDVETGTPFEKLSGKLGRRKYHADLSPFAGKDVEIRLVFWADSYTQAPGVKLHDWKLWAQ